MLATDNRVGPETCCTLTAISQGGGRIRLRTSGFDFNEVRAVAIEDAVAKVTGVHAACAYPRSASVVIWYTPDDCDTGAVLSVIAEAQHIPVDSVAARDPHSAPFRRSRCGATDCRRNLPIAETYRRPCGRSAHRRG